MAVHDFMLQYRYTMIKYTLHGGLLLEITCYRDTEVSTEHRQFSAMVYNLAWTQLARSAAGTLFIPIRSMQYLAILDKEELVFLDGERKCWIDIAWRNFKPQSRLTLDDPVDYDAVYYRPDAVAIMSRLQAELPRALQELTKKSRVDGPARSFQVRCLWIIRRINRHHPVPDPSHLLWHI
jgi:hypothetical protein